MPEGEAGAPYLSVAPTQSQSQRRQHQSRRKAPLCWVPRGWRFAGTERHRPCTRMCAALGLRSTRRAVARLALSFPPLRRPCKRRMFRNMSCEIALVVPTLNTCASVARPPELNAGVEHPPSDSHPVRSLLLVLLGERTEESKKPATTQSTQTLSWATSGSLRPFGGPIWGRGAVGLGSV